MWIKVISNTLNVKLIVFMVSSRKKIATSNTSSARDSKDRRFAVITVGLGLFAFVVKIAVAVSVIINNYAALASDLSSLIVFTNACVLSVENASAFYVNMFVNSVFRREFKIFCGLQKPAEMSSTGASDRDRSMRNGID